MSKKELHLRRVENGFAIAALASTAILAILNPPWLPFLLGLMPAGVIL